MQKIQFWIHYRKFHPKIPFRSCINDCINGTHCSCLRHIFKCPAPSFGGGCVFPIKDTYADPWMLESIIRADPLCRIYSQHLVDQIFGFWSHSVPFRGRILKETKQNKSGIGIRFLLDQNPYLKTSLSNTKTHLPYSIHK